MSEYITQIPNLEKGNVYTIDVADSESAVNVIDYITLNVPPRAFSNVPLQIWSL